MLGLPQVFPSMGPAVRASLIRAGLTPQQAEELWCKRCSTALEDIRDGFAEGGPTFLRLVATVAAFVPGIGTAAATVLSAAASLAEGKAIDDALVDAALSAIPAGPAFQAAGAAGAALARGESPDDALFAGFREAMRAEFGDLGAAAADAAVAVLKGKQLQDAGFAALKAFAKGNTLAERAASYAQTIARAAQSGRDLEDVLRSDLVADVARATGLGPMAEKQLAPALAKLQATPVLLDKGSQELATALGVAEPIARAAQAVLRGGDGAVDQELVDLLTKTATQRAAERFGAAAVAASPFATYTEQRALEREELVVAMARLDAGGLSYRAARAGTSAPPSQSPTVVHVPAPDVVAAPVPVASAPRNGAGSDVALGAVVAAAGVALFFWATAK